MKKHIAEDLPARKHPQAQMSSPSKPGANKPSAGNNKPKSGVEKTEEERISQAASDIRLRSRRENKTLLIPILFSILNLFPSIENLPGYLKIETLGC